MTDRDAVLWSVLHVNRMGVKGLDVCLWCCVWLGAFLSRLQMEDIRVELAVQRQLGQTPCIRLPDHRAVQLAAERQSLLQEIARLENQEDARVAQRADISARRQRRQAEQQ